MSGATRGATYTKVVREGHYAPGPRGLHGKLDNVRKYWENQLTRFYLAPYLERLLQKRRSLRILDMGCGSGEGWDLLREIPDLRDDRWSLLSSARVELYRGVDLCSEMIHAARTRFHSWRAADFQLGDLGEPGDWLSECELYFSSYGSPSHLEDERLAILLEAIARKAPSGAVVVLDMIGQFSLEWPSHWSGTTEMRPYNMLWLYPPHERSARRADFADYRVRYWGGEELSGFLNSLPHFGRRLRNLQLFDRSVFVGRHLDTLEFSPFGYPVRAAVNGLFEFNHYTRLSDLKVDPLPEGLEGEPRVFLHAYRETWNAVAAIFALLERGELGGRLQSALEHLSLPKPLQEGLDCLVQHARQLSWRKPAAPLRNSLQPEMAFFLRQLEFHLQRGLGCGHGLVAIAEVA